MDKRALSHRSFRLHACEFDHLAHFSVSCAIRLPKDAGDIVEIQLPAGKFRAQAVLPYVIGLLAAGMVVALVWALKKKPLAQPVTPS